jgi:hypothetical protein
MLNRSDLFALGRAGTALGIEVAGLALFLLALCGIALTGGFYGIPFSVYYLPSALFLLWGLRPRGTGSASLPFARGELMRVALFALAGSVVSLGISYLTTIVVGSSSGIAKAGLWATLLSIAAPILLVPRTLNSYFLPRLSLMGSRSAEAFRALSRLHQRGSSLLALVCVGAPLVLTRETIAWGVGGTGDPGLALSWRFLCAASYGIFRGEPLITAVGALGYTGLTAAVSAVSGALCVGIWLALLPAGGLPAVAAGSAAFSILAPVLIAAASRLRTEKLHPPVELLPADGVFILICALSFAGALESALPQAFALGAMLAVAAAGGFGLRRRAEALRAELAVQADVVFPVDLAAPPPGPVRP